MTIPDSDPARLPDLLPPDLDGVRVDVALAKRDGDLESEVFSFTEGAGEDFRHFWGECCGMFGADPVRRIVVGVQRITPMSTIGGAPYVRASFLIVEDGGVRPLTRAQARALILDDPQAADNLLPDEMSSFSA